jgi:Lon protease-like protein
MSESAFSPLADFSGVARLFPLPNLVLFPGAVAALHIFEPRYVAMMEDALAGDRLIAMALLLPGWEREYEGRPPVGTIVCVGRVNAHARLPDGRFNLLLSGVTRAAIRRELPPDRPFRRAEVELLHDLERPGRDAQLELLREALRKTLSRHVPASPAAREQFDAMMSHKLPLSALLDVIAHAAAWPVEFKQQLLQEQDVERRAALVLDRLHHVEPGAVAFDEPSPGAWPPRFSDN